MKTEMSTHHESFYDRLKKKTVNLHVEAHSIPYIKNLMDNNIPLESYIGHLRCLSIIYATLENQIKRTEDPELLTFTEKYIPKLSFLQNDLKALDADNVQDIIPAVRNALAVADKIILYSKSSAHKLVSYIYILEGSLNGGNIIKENLLKIFDFEDNKGVEYFSSLSQAQRGFWKDFTHKLNSKLTQAEQQTQVLQTAADAFYDLMKVYENLFPVRNSLLSKHITSMNPEAGDHPVPDSPEEIAAAQKAGQLCFDEFPALSERFGERGLRFTISDAAWLTTLADESIETARKQTDWLSGFLFRKGIPSYMIERQLIILNRILSIDNPSKAKKYSLLCKIAEEMADKRATYISENDFEEANNIAIELTSEIPDNSKRLRLIGRNLGKIIASSLVDQKALQVSDNEVLRWFEEDENFSSRENAQIKKIIESIKQRLNK